MSSLAVRIPLAFKSRLRRASNLASQMRTRFLVRRPRRSVYFFTLHKCASSLFSSFVLRNLDGLTHVDRAKGLASGKLPLDTSLSFHRKGIVYGPIRLSVSDQSPIYRTLIKPVFRREFMRNKRAVFLVRDPRDILVSAYYSFGYTHGLSQVEKLRQAQLDERHRIQNMTIDDYVLSYAPDQAEHFSRIEKLSEWAEEAVILRYEDMIENFDGFIAEARRVLPMSDQVSGEIYRRSRPKSREDQSSHRRSGTTGGFRAKLKPETVETLNHNLRLTLESFGYPP